MDNFLKRLFDAKQKADKRNAERQQSSDEIANELTNLKLQIRNLFTELSQQSSLKVKKYTGQVSYPSVVEGKDNFTKTGTIYTLWSENETKVCECFIINFDPKLNSISEPAALVFNRDDISLYNLLQKPIDIWANELRSYFQNRIISFFETEAARNQNDYRP